MRLRLRRAWSIAHRWLGLTLGWLLIAAGITGCMLVVARPLDVAMHPELFASSGRSRAALQPVVSRLRAEFGPEAALNIRLPTREMESLQAIVSGAWSGTVYVDAASGQELGRRAVGQGFFNTLFELHSTLFAGDTGRAILALAALAYCVLLISGIVLWWPRQWAQAFAIRTRFGSAVALMDLHRVAGATLGLLVLVAVVTGAYMAWRPIAGWVTAIAGGAPARPALSSPLRNGSAVPADVDSAIRLAREHWPHAVVTTVHVPPRSMAANRVRLRLPDDPHPIGMSTAWVDPLSGRVTEARRWSELDIGSRAYSVIYPLHAGSLYGLTTMLATFGSGLAVAFFGCTGVWSWLRRRPHS